MAYIMNKSGGDFQQGGCLYKPPSVFNEYMNTDICQASETSLRKSRPPHLAVVLRQLASYLIARGIDCDEKYSLPYVLCVCGKFS